MEKYLNMKRPLRHMKTRMKMFNIYILCEFWRKSAETVDKIQYLDTIIQN